MKRITFNRITYSFYTLLVLFSTTLFCISCQSNSSSKSKNNIIVEKTTPVDSIDLFKRLIAGDSTNADLYFSFADYCFRHDDHNGALRNLGQAMIFEPGNIDHIILLSDVYLAIDKFDDARDLLQKMVKKDDNHIMAKLKLAKLEIAFEDYDQAIININRALRIEPKNYYALYLKGVINLEKGNTKNAVDFFNRSIENNAQFIPPYLQMALLYADLGDMKAVDYFNSILNINPQDTTTMYTLALFYQYHEMEDKAIDIYNNILQLDSTHFNAYHNIGYIYLVYLNNYPQAIEYFERAIENNRNFYQAYYNLGYCYEKQKEYEQALINYKKAVEIYPNYPLVIEALNRIDKALH